MKRSRIALSFLAALALTAGCKTVQIKTTPTRAEVYGESSDAVLGSTPFRIQQVTSARRYELRKQGYEPKLITVSPESPSVVEVELDIAVSGQTLIQLVDGIAGQVEVQRTYVHAEREVIERSPNVTAVRRLTDLPSTRFVQYFALSPDGRTLLLEIFDEETIVGGRKVEYSNLWSVDADTGGAMRRITQGKYYDRTPTYSPDGSTVFFSSDRAGQFNVFRLSLESLGGLGLITTAGTKDLYPSISPAGDQLLYTAEMTGVSQTQLWSLPINRGLPRQLREGTAGKWSPDGKKVLFSEGDRTVRKMTTWTMNPDGSSPTQLTSSPDYDDINPVWSPDGKQILFASDRGMVDGKNNFDIWLMNADGSDPKQLTTNGARDDLPIFSPDGKTVYFRSNRGLKWDVWVMELADTE